MRPRRRGVPKPIRSVLSQVLDDLGLEAAAAAHRIGEVWEQVVGADVARHCRPIGVRGKLLEVEVDTSVWCQQLQMQSPELLAALRAELAEEAPAGLRFRVGYDPGPRASAARPERVRE